MLLQSLRILSACLYDRPRLPADVQREDGNTRSRRLGGRNLIFPAQSPNLFGSPGENSHKYKFRRYLGDIKNSRALSAVSFSFTGREQQRFVSIRYLFFLLR